MAASGDSVKLFLDSRRQDLRRIAARTCGEYTIDDVCSEAWLVADEISQKRGFAIDFLNRDDQELLLSWLYGRLVRYADKSVRYAVKLDRDWDSEDADSAAGALARLLTAPDQFDPLVRLLDEEDRFDPMALIQYSYSQASAYVILLHRFDWDLADLADHLRDRGGHPQSQSLCQWCMDGQPAIAVRPDQHHRVGLLAKVGEALRVGQGCRIQPSATGLVYP